MALASAAAALVVGPVATRSCLSAAGPSSSSSRLSHHCHRHHHQRRRFVVVGRRPSSAHERRGQHPRGCRRPVSSLSSSSSSSSPIASTSTARPRRAAEVDGNDVLLASGSISGAKTAALVAATAAVVTTAPWWTATAPDDDDDDDDDTKEAPVYPPEPRRPPATLMQLIALSSLVSLRGPLPHRSLCEEEAPHHFHSAANLFQHHMSKEKEKDDEANEYYHDQDHEDDEHEHAHEHETTSPKKAEECFLCRVHRQGPCGPMWKDLEACVDRQERGEDDPKHNHSDSSCRHCASQFERCWKKHAGLYSLIALDEQSQVLQQLKKHMEVVMVASESSEGGGGAGDNNALSCSGVAVDWEPWNQFLVGSTASHDIVRNYRRRISQNGNVRFRGPLWKRFEKHQVTNPLLVTVRARVPALFESDPVRYGVALDQQNRVLGFVEVPQDDDTTTATHGEEETSSLTMKIIIVPGLTESVKIQMWTVPPPSPGGDGAGLGGRPRVVVRETSPERVDYGASTNSMLAIQNQRTRTQRVKSS